MSYTYAILDVPRRSPTLKKMNMKVTLESTDKIVELKTPTGTVPARVWEGQTESGIPCHALVTRIAVHKDLDASQFETELQECRPVSREVARVFYIKIVL